MNDRPSDAFRTTLWTQVLAARGESEGAKTALRDLCGAYYAPVEAFVRCYSAGRDDARDLTHQFFIQLLERDSLKGVDRAQGRFRTYLLGAVKHFLSDRTDHERAAKRGGGRLLQSLNAPLGHDQSDRGEREPLDPVCPNAFPPDAFFDREWALALVENAMACLREEFENRGDLQRFEVLKHWLLPVEDGADASAQEASRVLGISETAVKVATHRLRKRFRHLVKDQIMGSVDDPHAVEEELGYLIEALCAVPVSPK